MSESLHDVTISNDERDFLRYDMHIDLLTRNSTIFLMILNILIILFPILIFKYIPKRVKVQHISIKQPLYTSEPVQYFTFYISNLKRMHESYSLTYSLFPLETNITEINFTSYFSTDYSKNKKIETISQVNWQANTLKQAILKSRYFNGAKSIKGILSFPKNVEISQIHCWLEYMTASSMVFHISLRFSALLILYFIYKYLRKEMRKKGYKSKEQLLTRLYIQIMLIVLFPIDIARDYLHPKLIRIFRFILDDFAQFFSTLIMCLFLCEQTNYNPPIKTAMTWITTISSFIFILASVMESSYNSWQDSIENQTNYSFYFYIILTFSTLLLVYLSCINFDPDHQYYVAIYSFTAIINHIIGIASEFLKIFEKTCTVYDFSEPFYIVNFVFIAILLTYLHAPIDPEFFVNGGFQEFHKNKKVKSMYQKQEEENANSTSLFSDSA